MKTKMDIARRTAVMEIFRIIFLNGNVAVIRYAVLGMLKLNS